MNLKMMKIENDETVSKNDEFEIDEKRIKMKIDEFKIDEN